MGHGTYSDTAYHNLRSSRVASVGVAAFTHTADIDHGRVAAGVHQRLHPHGIRIRESRDSVEHPESLAIGVMFDVTGSMLRIPRTLQAKLPNLMRMLLDRGWCAHPQILFGAIGDVTSDGGPVQVGQFESDVQMDEDLDKVWLEGGGGGGDEESYELAHYFFDRHTSTDCWERRQHKGFLFTIGDEAFRPRIKKDQVQRVFGSSPQEDLRTADVVASLREKYHVFHIIATRGSKGRDASIEARWRSLLGDYVLKLDDADLVCELIGLVIGVVEGNVEIEAGLTQLQEMGVDAASVAAVRAAVSPFEVVARGIRLRREGATV